MPTFNQNKKQKPNGSKVIQMGAPSQQTITTQHNLIDSALRLNGAMYFLWLSYACLVVMVIAAPVFWMWLGWSYCWRTFVTATLVLCGAAITYAIKRDKAHHRAKMAWNQLQDKR